MSIALQKLVWDTDLPMARKMVLLSLADQSNDQGECYPSIATIERRCSASRRTVFSVLADLEQAGLLTREPLPSQRVLFRINVQQLQQTALPLPPPVPEKARATAARCSIRTGAGNAPVREAHRCGSRTGAGAAPPGAAGAPDRCSSRTPIKATINEPPRNHGGDARALAREVDPDPKPDLVAASLMRDDEWNRLTDFDQRLIDPYLGQLPLGVSLEVFANYVRHVQVMRRAMSGPAWMLIAERLRQLQAEGHNLDKVLKYTIRMQWTDPAPDPGEKPKASRGPPRNSVNASFESATYTSTSDDDLPPELRNDDDAGD